jgi:hypothetical protein
METNKKRLLLSKALSNFNHEVDPQQLSKGIDSEQEHNKGGKALNVAKGNKMTTARIAIAHLKEDPKYYSHLEKMEQRYGDKK